MDSVPSGETSKPPSTSKTLEVQSENPSPPRMVDLASSPHSRVNPTSPSTPSSASRLAKCSIADPGSSSPPKRLSPDSPDRGGSVPPSKRRKLIEGRVDSVPSTSPPEDDDEVVPSSETDDEDMDVDLARLPPRTTPSLAVISKLLTVNAAKQPSSDALKPRDIESDNSQLSAAETDGSEAQVSRQLDDDEDQAMDAADDESGDESEHYDAGEVSMDVPSAEAGELESRLESTRPSARGASTRSRAALPVIKEDPPTSDAESVDSEKALERAKHARLSTLEDDDDDDLLDDDLTRPATKKVPPPKLELRTPKGTPNPTTPVRKYKSPNALPEDHIRRIRLGIESNSPLTSPSSPRKLGASKNIDSPSRPPLPNGRRMTPSQGQVVVEIPPVAPGVDLSSYVRVSDKLPSPKARRLPTPSAPGPSKPARLPKSAGNSALDALLKEKKVWNKKYGDLLVPAAGVVKKEDQDSAAAGPSGSQTTPRDSLSPTNSLMGDLLLEPERLKNILSVDQALAKREEEAQKAAVIRERNKFWQPLEDDVMDDPSESCLPFPADAECKSPSLRLLKKAMDDGNSHAAVALLNSGALLADPSSLPDEVIDWILDLCVLHPHAPLAVATLNFLRRSLEEETESFAEIELDIGTIRRHLTMLGMRNEFSAALSDDGDSNEDTPVLSKSWVKNAGHRNDAILRLLDVVSIFATHQQIHSRDVPKIVLALILLGQDPDTTAETSRAISQAVASVLKTFDAVDKPSRIIRLERDVCLTILDALAERSAAEALKFVSIIPRVDVRTARIARWTALGALKGSNAVKSAAQDEFMGVPNINSLALMVQPETEKEELASKFNVDKAGTTDFKELRKNVSLLSVVLTDLSLYLKAPNAADNIEKLIRSIGYVSSGITDRSNEDHDRTEAKGEIQHLKIRVNYQTSSKAKLDIYRMLASGSKDPKVQTDLKGFFSSKS